MSDRKNLLEPSPGERMRQIRSRFWTILCMLSAVVVLLPLLSIFIYVLRLGFSGLSVSFFLNLPKPVGELGGGMGHAIVGTLILVGLACLFGLPIGIAAGIYLAEIGRGRLAQVIRFTADVLGGVPSITVGVFVYTVIVVSMRRFSALAGGVALALLMLPTVTRTTEELLRLVPPHLREAALGLGVPAWRTTLFVVLRTALPGITTGVMLAVARISGETAPLLFTALGSRYYSTDVDKPIASLPVQIFDYAKSPYPDWRNQAWTGALVLVVIIFSFSLTARIVASRSMGASR